MKESLTWLRKRLLQRFIGSFDLRRQRMIAWESMATAGVDSVRFTRGGLVWNVNLLPYDDISWHLFVDGGFQTGEIDVVLRWAEQFGIFSGSRNVLIDAGANLGTTCIPIVHAAGCRALAIEPVVANVSALRMNVESNAFADRILLANKAVATEPGRLRMSLSNTSGGHAVSGDATSLPRNETVGYEDVEADTLSGIVAAAGLDAAEIALVWADVQGCELAVIESGQEIWAQGVPLWAEVEPRSLGRQGTLDIFAQRAAVHFDRFIESPDLLRLGTAAVPRPISEFADLIAHFPPEQLNTDVMLLPKAFSARPR